MEPSRQLIVCGRVSMCRVGGRQVSRALEVDEFRIPGAMSGSWRVIDCDCAYGVTETAARPQTTTDIGPELAANRLHFHTPN